MTKILKAPTQLLAVGLFALTGLAAGAPMAELIDCADSFWAVACSEDENGVLVPTERDVIVGDPVTIDSDPTCVEIDGGAFIICTT